MNATSINQPPRRAFQFRIATLLIGMAWAAIVSLALATPTMLWLNIIEFATLIAILMSVLVGVYRTNGRRAMAIGFFVFSAGYLFYLSMVFGRFDAMLLSAPKGLLGLFEWLFHAIHPGAGQTMAGNWGSDHAHFVSICHHTLATLLGVIGAIAAQLLYATRKDEPPRE
jgi:hypothetical protein